MYLEISLLIFGVALLLLVLFCIPILLKLWRAVSDVTVTLQALNERLPAILKNMEEISTNINNSTTAINGEVQKCAAMAQRVHGVIHEVVRGIELISPRALNSPLFRKITELMAVVKGVRVFLNVLTGKQRV
ncbi:MAG: DUF948 domain-containing protein [Smithellaceae bacterium]|nr:DUF948 domain-containing protein [Smithellaceae bacterium]